MQAFFADYLTQFEILGSVLVALLLGGLIGLEREDAEKPAGLRTHMLVAAAAALGLSVALSQYVVAVGATVMALITLRLIRMFERYLNPNKE